MLPAKKLEDWQTKIIADFVPTNGWLIYGSKRTDDVSHVEAINS